MKPSAIFEELRSELWAMEPERLAAFFRRVSALDISSMSQASSRPASLDALPVEMRGSVAVIPISGTLMKKKPAWMHWFGVDATDTGQVKSAVEQAANDPKVRSIVLHVNSPGGQAGGVLEAADAIHAARSKKPVHAIIDGMAASGAYWLASQANSISAPADALAGSIGVYQVVYDESKAAEAAGVKVHVVRSGEHKGMGVPGAPVTDAQLSMMQSIVDGLAGMFVGSVARGRAKKADQINELATGAVWLAGDAKSKGLVDHTEPVAKAFSRLAPPITKEVPMADTNPTAEDVVAKALTAEKKRVADITAAFPKHAQFALEQIQKGSSPAEANDAFKDLRMKELEAQVAAQAKALEDAKAAKPEPTPAPAASAPPVPRGADPSASTGIDFLTAARELAEKKNISVADAMSKIARANPDLHRAYVQAMRERSPEIQARKKMLGMR